MDFFDYRTSDMQFASFLVMRGENLSSVARSGRKAMWVFKIEPEVLAGLEAEWPFSKENRLFSVYSALKGQVRAPKNQIVKNKK